MENYIIIGWAYCMLFMSVSRKLPLLINPDVALKKKIAELSMISLSMGIVAGLTIKLFSECI